MEREQNVLEVKVKERWGIAHVRDLSNQSSVLKIDCSITIDSAALDILADRAKININFLIDYLHLNTYDSTYFRDFNARVDSTNYKDKIAEIQRDVKNFIEEIKRTVRELKETIEAREELIQDIKAALPENKTYIIS